MRAAKSAGSISRRGATAVSVIGSTFCEAGNVVRRLLKPFFITPMNKMQKPESIKLCAMSSFCRFAIVPSGVSTPAPKSSIAQPTAVTIAPIQVKATPESGTFFRLRFDVASPSCSYRSALPNYSQPTEIWLRHNRNTRCFAHVCVHCIKTGFHSLNKPRVNAGKRLWITATRNIVVTMSASITPLGASE